MSSAPFLALAVCGLALAGSLVGCGDDASEPGAPATTGAPGISSNTAGSLPGASDPEASDPQMTPAPNPNAGGGSQDASTVPAP